VRQKVDGLLGLLKTPVIPLQVLGGPA